MPDREKVIRAVETCFNSWIDKHRNMGLDSLYTSIRRYIMQILCERDGITQEKAIDYLRETGWMARHDREMSSDSLTAVVNGLMRDGNKSISINFYPYKEDEHE